MPTSCSEASALQTQDLTLITNLMFASAKSYSRYSLPHSVENLAGQDHCPYPTQIHSSVISTSESGRLRNNVPPYLRSSESIRIVGAHNAAISDLTDPIPTHILCDDGYSVGGPYKFAVRCSMRQRPRWHLWQRHCVP